MTERVLYMKKKLVLSICMLLITCCLGGCAGHIPDMTEEQRSAISEYAVELLLKYDTSQPSRLVDLSELEEPETTPVPEVTAKPESTAEPDTNENGEDSGMDEVADTPTIQVGEGVDVELPQLDTLEETLLLPEEVTLEYCDYQVLSEYVDKVDTDLVIEADTGKKLLVFEFVLQNSGNIKQSVDMLQDSIRHNVVIGEENVSSMVTMLSNDLITYMGEVNPNESIGVVLLAEVDETLIQEAESISVVFSRQEYISEIKVK